MTSSRSPWCFKFLDSNQWSSNHPLRHFTSVPLTQGSNSSYSKMCQFFFFKGIEIAKVERLVKSCQVETWCREIWTHILILIFIRKRSEKSDGKVCSNFSQETIFGRMNVCSKKKYLFGMASLEWLGRVSIKMFDNFTNIFKIVFRWCSIVPIHGHFCEK